MSRNGVEEKLHKKPADAPKLCTKILKFILKVEIMNEA